MSRKGGRASEGKSTEDAPVASTPRDAASLRRELAQLVRDVRVDDEAAMQRARTRVIKAVLLWEFGQGFREYSEWQPMVEALAQTLERSEDHRDEFARMVKGLQAGRDR